MDVRSHSVRLDRRQSTSAIRRRPFSSSREYLSAYVSGYADGEGCFTVSIAPRATLEVGWEVRPSFSVSQNGDRAEVLHAIQELLRVRKHPARPKRQDTEVGDAPARGSPRTVVPHFESYPLLSGKRHDFARFAFICRLMAAGEHRRREGLVRIVELARAMNPSGSRRYDASEILRQLQGEEIVCASGNGGGTRSSDLHEWRNDLGAVSTRDPVKL